MIQSQARTRRFKLHHLPKAVIPSFFVLVRQRNNAARSLHLQPKPLREFSFSVNLIFLSHAYFFDFRLFLPGGSLDSQTTETQWYSAQFGSSQESETLSVSSYSGHEFRKSFFYYGVRIFFHPFKYQQVSLSIAALPSWNYPKPFFHHHPPLRLVCLCDHLL